jgi:hypothetical protein
MSNDIIIHRPGKQWLSINIEPILLGILFMVHRAGLIDHVVHDEIILVLEVGLHNYCTLQDILT